MERKKQLTFFYKNLVVWIQLLLSTAQNGEDGKGLKQRNV